MILIIFCLISCKIRQLSKESNPIHFITVNEEYRRSEYFDFQEISPFFFKYSSNGDKTDHPLSNIFENISSNKYWVGKQPSTNFRNSIFITFQMKAEIKSIVYDTFYSTKSKPHVFSGFPLITNIYSSPNNNSPFVLQATFSGNLSNNENCQKIQFLFDKTIFCKRLQIEFVKVSPDFIFSNSSECPVAKKINFIGKLLHYKTIFTQISDKLPEYVNLQKISINEFTYSTANDKVNHLKTSKFEHNFFSHSFKYPLFMNFTKPTTLESIIRRVFITIMKMGFYMIKKSVKKNKKNGKNK